MVQLEGSVAGKLAFTKTTSGRERMKRFAAVVFILTVQGCSGLEKLLFTPYVEPSPEKSAQLTIENNEHVSGVGLYVYIYETADGCFNRRRVPAVDYKSSSTIRISGGEPLAIFLAPWRRCRLTMEFTPTIGAHYKTRMWVVERHWGPEDECDGEVVELRSGETGEPSVLPVMIRKKQFHSPFSEAGPWCEQDKKQ
jgi:hypothetical protein